MNYPAASSGVSKSFTKEVNAPRGGEYNPERFNRCTFKLQVMNTLYILIFEKTSSNMFKDSCISCSAGYPNLCRKATEISTGSFKEIKQIKEGRNSFVQVLPTLRYICLPVRGINNIKHKAHLRNYNLAIPMFRSEDNSWDFRVKFIWDRNYLRLKIRPFLACLQTHLLFYE